MDPETRSQQSQNTDQMSQQSLMKKEKNDELQIQKKKLKVVKEALKEEMKQKKELELRLKKELEIQESMRQLLEEKEKKFMNALNEKANLEDSVIQLSRQMSVLTNQSKDNPYGNPTPEQSPMISLRQRLRPLNNFMEQNTKSSKKSQNKLESIVSEDVKRQTTKEFDGYPKPESFLQQIEIDTPQKTNSFTSLNTPNNQGKSDVSENAERINSITSFTVKCDCNIKEYEDKINSLESQLKLYQIQVDEQKVNLIEKEEEKQQIIKQKQEELQQYIKKNKQLEDKNKEVKDKYKNQQQLVIIKEQQIIDEREVAQNLFKTNQELFDKDIEQLKQQFLQSELVCNNLKDDKFQLQEFIDQQKQIILENEKNLQLMQDEVTIRRVLVDEMSDGLIKKDKEYNLIKQELIQLKMKAKEFDQDSFRKFGAVKIQTLKNIPVCLEFVQGGDQMFLQIESKQGNLQINCDDIEDIQENNDKRLVVVYYLNEQRMENSKAIKKQEVFECFENNLILNNFKKIKKISDLKPKVEQIPQQIPQQTPKQTPKQTPQQNRPKQFSKLF